MSTDTPAPEEGQTPEEQLQAEAPAAPGEETAAVEEAAPAATEEAADDIGDSGLPELTLGAGAPADEVVLASAPTIVRGKVDKDGTAIGTGRRKTSVARVRIKDGDGKFIVNGRDFSEYFSTERDQNMVQEPLKATETRDSVDVWVRVNGGGTTGQTGAVVLGIARALEARNESLHHTLSSRGFLSRDDRMVERKKYGRRKARRSFQFSKR
jgi:small subunit ribosomal protein S9